GTAGAFQNLRSTDRQTGSLAKSFVSIRPAMLAPPQPFAPNASLGTIGLDTRPASFGAAYANRRPALVLPRADTPRATANCRSAEVGHLALCFPPPRK